MHSTGGGPGILFYGEWKSTKKERRLGLHRNNGLEIVLVTKGTVHWAIDGREAPVPANSFFYTLPWQEHGGIEEVQPSCEILYLCLALKENHGKARRQFRFHPTLGFTPPEERNLSAALTGHSRQILTADENGRWLMRHFFEVARDRSFFGGRLRVETVRMLLLNLARLAKGQVARAGGPSEAQRRARRFSEALVGRCAEEWTLETMSAVCGLGRTRFAELVKEMTGDAPMTYLNRLRVRAAQRLLTSGRSSITQIAHATGFNSSQYFATVFKEFTGMEPRAYRGKQLAETSKAPHP